MLPSSMHPPHAATAAIWQVRSGASDSRAHMGNGGTQQGGGSCSRRVTMYTCSLLYLFVIGAQETGVS
jgi:hypothetical protein